MKAKAKAETNTKTKRMNVCSKNNKETKNKPNKKERIRAGIWGFDLI